MSSNTAWVQEAEGVKKEVVDVKKRLTDSVDRFLDSSPAFAAALRQSFLQFHVLQPPASSSSTSSSPPPPAPPDQKGATPILPPGSILPALKSLQQKLTDGVDPKLRRLSLRNFTYWDIQALIDTQSKLGNQSKVDPSKPLNFDQYECSARLAFKHMAVCKSKRLGLYMLGGMAIIHLVHGMVRKVPYIGRHALILSRIIIPTPLMGPLLGFIGASSWEERTSFFL